MSQSAVVIAYKNILIFSYQKVRCQPNNRPTSDNQVPPVRMTNEARMVGRKTQAACQIESLPYACMGEAKYETCR